MIAQMQRATPRAPCWRPGILPTSSCLPLWDLRKATGSRFAPSSMPRYETNWVLDLLCCTHRTPCVADKTIVPVDSAQNARSVREDTAELARYLLSDGSAQRRPSFLQRGRPSLNEVFGPEFADADSIEGSIRRSSGTIPEVTEPPSPEDGEHGAQATGEDGPSALANLLKNSSPPSSVSEQAKIPPPRFENLEAGHSQPSDIDEIQQRPETREAEASEYTPLLERPNLGSGTNSSIDIEGQKSSARKRWLHGVTEQGRKVERRLVQFAKVASCPSRWNRKAIWETAVVEPVSCLPAVAVGLLLNILDALSYGKNVACRHHTKYMTDDTRHDLVSTRNSSIFSFGVCWHFHLLRQHHCCATCLLHRQHIQGCCGI
jgi:hypothetical protein